MSGQCTGWVLRSGPRDRAMRAVLVTIADAANRDGCHAHPGIEAMIDGSLYSRATVVRIVRRLVDEGWLEVEHAGGGRGMATIYRVPMAEEPAHHEQDTADKPAHLASETCSSGDKPAHGTPSDQQKQNANGLYNEMNNGTSGDRPRTDLVVLPSPATPAEDARALTCAFWEQANPKPAVKFIALLKVVERFLEAGWPGPSISRALVGTRAYTVDAIEFTLNAQRPESRRRPKSFDLLQRRMAEHQAAER